MNGIIIDGKVYEVVPYSLNDCHKCELKKECDRVTGSYCLADKLFGNKDMRIFRFSQELTDKLNK